MPSQRRPTIQGQWVWLEEGRAGRFQGLPLVLEDGELQEGKNATGDKTAEPMDTLENVFGKNVG